MADRIRYNLNVQVENGLYKRDINAQGREVTLNDQGAAAGIMSCSTASDGDALDVGDVAIPGWLYLHNLDATNFVLWGPDDGGGGLVAIGMLMPGEEAWFRLLPSATIRLAADTTTVKVQYEVFSD